MAKNGQSSARDAGSLLVEQVRQAIVAGRHQAGRFLPTIRELSAKYRASPETVRRGLKQLEGEGLLTAKPRKGFRVTERPASPAATGPVAYVTDYGLDMSGAQPANWALAEALQRAAAVRGAAVLSTPCGGHSRDAILERLRAGLASGIVLDSINSELTDTISQSGLPVVMVNSWSEERELDVVLQDNYRGGFLAAKHLVDSGCRRVAWVGAVSEFVHSRERHAGAVAALTAAGLGLAGTVTLGAGDGVAGQIRNLLAKPDRPDGFLSFWKGGSWALKKAAVERGLGLETDIRVVGWTVEEMYESEHRAIFADGRMPPAVVWKAASMAERAMELLDRRRQGRAGEPVRVCVPTRLRI